MKKLFYLAGVLALLATASCKDDDSDVDADPITGNFMFDGKGYTARKGFVVDNGGLQTHYNYDFYLVDKADITLSDLESSTGELNTTFFLFAELFSPGDDEFRTGTFTFNENADDDDYFFVDVDLVVDSNNDNKLSLADTFYDAEGGTITVAGTPNNYTLTFNLTLDNGKKLTGSYTGNFQYVDHSGKRAPDDVLRKSTTSKLQLK